MAAGKFYSDWLVKDDEYHPDNRRAAGHADAEARQAARRMTLGVIARYEAIPEPTPLDKAGLELMRENLRRIEQDIRDHAPTTDPEE